MPPAGVSVGFRKLLDCMDFHNRGRRFGQRISNGRRDKLTGNFRTEEMRNNSLDIHWCFLYNNTVQAEAPASHLPAKPGMVHTI